MLLTTAQAPAQILASLKRLILTKQFLHLKTNLFKELGRAPSSQTLN